MSAFSLAKPDEQTGLRGKTQETDSESRVPASENQTAQLDGELKQIADALWELRGLLERYAPAWYTKQYDERAASALRVAGRF